MTTSLKPTTNISMFMMGRGLGKSFPNDPSFQVAYDEIQQDPIPLMISPKKLEPKSRDPPTNSLFYQQNCGVEPAESVQGFFKPPEIPRTVFDRFVVPVFCKTGKSSSPKKVQFES